MLGSAPADEAAIGSVMSSYEAALNASNTEAVMPLYAEDGVFSLTPCPHCGPRGLLSDLLRRAVFPYARSGCRILI